MTLFQAFGQFAGSGAVTSAFQFITTTSFSAVSSASTDNCFSADFDHYMLIPNMLSSSATSKRVDIRLRASGTDATTSAYTRQQIIASGGTYGSGGRSTDATMAGALGYANSSFRDAHILYLSRPYSAVDTTGYSFTSYQSALVTGIANMQQVYYHDVASSYDGFTVIPTGGTVTGSVSVYGLVV